MYFAHHRAQLAKKKENMGDRVCFFFVYRYDGKERKRYFDRFHKFE